MSGIFCPNCGMPLEDGDQFCTNCGTKLETAAKTVSEKKATSGNKNYVYVLIVVAAVIALSFFAFGRNRIEGSWSATEDGETLIIEFEKNGYGKLELIAGMRSMSFGFTYEYSDDMLCVVSDETNSTFDCKIKGNKMFWQINGQSIAFDRIT